jgi:succinate dehydrogenase / fumarate reductase cytochrome b subunit
MSDATQGRAGGLLTSTIALKIAMAVSGAAFAGFVLFHMVGNLQIFSGQEAYNDYAAFLQGLGGLLWVARIGLLALIGIHVASAVTLWSRNRAARPEEYRRTETLRTSTSARLMLETGLIVVFFVVYHLLHFTVGAVHPEHYGVLDPLGRPDIFGNLVRSFQDPLIAGAYIVGNVALASHLSHALTSMFSTLGLAVGRFRRPAELVGPTFAIVVLVGNLSMPIACLLGIVQVEVTTP